MGRYSHVDISTLPTLFPAPVATAITALATSARYSLRISAFFIEMILEGSQYSTRLGLGTARRALITAISSARRVYLFFLDILDQYTNLGIYIIHHAFTLAELFAMSGFYLTASAINTAHTAAQESVELFDSLFGSNDSSRALSGIITLLRRELLEDERFKERDTGALRSLTAMTKALTAFACLQSATEGGFEHTSQCTCHTMSTESPPTHGTDTPDKLFPHDSLLKNIHRFMRFSSAAYGQNFLRILGMGSTDFTFPSTGRHHANTWSFAQHTNLSIDCILLSSHTETTPSVCAQKASTLVHYLAVDHKLQSVILTCRGTLGLSDILTDLTCDYCSVEIEGAGPDAEYYAHAGMYRSALGLTSKRSSVHQALVLALTKYPSYGLVVTGHSLGGGVAGLLTPAVHPSISTPFVTSFASGLPPGRPIHCYTYGVPAIVSPELAEYTKGLITSVIHNSDIVPSLSLGVLRDLKNIALTLFEEGNVAEEIVARVCVVMTSEQNERDTTSDWLLSLVKTMRADMDNDKLYPPGDVYIMVSRRVESETLQKCESVIERFSEPLFSRTMLKDHMPTHYERATQLLVDGLAQNRA
ncbi:Alpha/Beta hydrolase protein [Papiliotrema laurentii]|uniref:sn-1-specific diacylglycerol lipase n=1 Tax=Papiliotrema laurentii TaxID=5418 RepID=A0AAD9FW06_PAPLA|nr:Alpha/Beta hydrolase protein [Papiliotrema laurentii]